jgi:hypothetical protein
MSAVNSDPVTVDGEIMWQVRDESLAKDLFGELNESFRPHMEWTWKMCSRHASKLSVAYRIDKRGRKWWLALLHLGNEFQRVHLHEVGCLSCKKKQVVADPTAPELYFGCPNEREALELGWQRPTVGCVYCGSKLPTRAMWSTYEY